MLHVTWHAGYDGAPRRSTVDAEPTASHDTLAGILAISLTGDVEVRHVITIDHVEEV